jgi:hypothetical protein
MNKHEWIREWRRQRIERRELQSSRSDDADDDSTSNADDDPQGYDQFTDDGGVGSDVLVLVGKAALLIVAMAIGVGVVWGFEVVLKGILILVSVAVGLLVLFRMANVYKDRVESIRSWSGWPFVIIPLLVTAALIVGNFWGWEAIIGIGIAIVFIFALLKGPPPPWPMWPF